MKTPTLLLALFVAIGLLPTIKRLNSPDIGGSATVTPVTAQAVPEPGALGLLVMVGALAAATPRRRKCQRHFTARSQNEPLPCFRENSAIPMIRFSRGIRM